MRIIKLGLFVSALLVVGWLLWQITLDTHSPAGIMRDYNTVFNACMSEGYFTRDECVTLAANHH